jgi:hypothetical protein
MAATTSQSGPTLPKARRWRPLMHDVNSMPDPEDVRSWVMRGLARALHQVG